MPFCFCKSRPMSVCALKSWVGITLQDYHLTNDTEWKDNDLDLCKSTFYEDWTISRDSVTRTSLQRNKWKLANFWWLTADNSHYFWNQTCWKPEILWPCAQMPGVSLGWKLWRWNNSVTVPGSLQKQFQNWKWCQKDVKSWFELLHT